MCRSPVRSGIWLLPGVCICRHAHALERLDKNVSLIQGFGVLAPDRYRGFLNLCICLYSRTLFLDAASRMSVNGRQRSPCDPAHFCRSVVTLAGCMKQCLCLTGLSVCITQKLESSDIRRWIYVPLFQDIKELNEPSVLCRELVTFSLMSGIPQLVNPHQTDGIPRWKHTLVFVFPSATFSWWYICSLYSWPTCTWPRPQWNPIGPKSCPS